jgi:hypothetical protein
VTGPLPALLEQPLIPPPLHGLNPRSIMGRAAWDEERRRVYRKYGFTCAACGVNGRDAFPLTRLEAHERFSVDYRARTMTLTGMEPVCPACHAFVHTGLLEIRLHRRELSRAMTWRVLEHGITVLGEVGGTVPLGADRLSRKLGLRHGLPVASPPPPTGWSGWRLIWDGKSYEAPYQSEAAWARAMRRT